MTATEANKIIPDRFIPSQLMSEQGFSLIELMVTVAIIGVLSTVAIPNYQLMSSKARTVEAKSGLSAMYTAEKAYYAEWSTYTYCLYQSGYIPEGSRRFYLTGFVTTTMSAATGNDQASGQPCNFGSIPWNGPLNRNDGIFPMNSWANPAMQSQGIGQEFNATTTSFSTVAYGSVSSVPVFDVWQITQDRVVTQIQVGY